MTGKCVVAVDAGTSGVHCLLVDLNGRTLASSREDWTYQTLPGLPLASEFDPDVFWQTIARNVALMIARIDPSEIIGVSATSQREGAVFLDKDGRELYAGPNIDLRAAGEGMAIDAEFGDRVYDITGHAPSLLFVPARLRWFRDNCREVFARISTVLTISDWIAYRLCGRMACEPCGANELGLADVRSAEWSSVLAQLLEIPDRILPEMARAGSRIGEVSAAAERATGVPRGTPVIAAAPDAQCGLLGMGLTHPGEAGITLGWSAPVQMVTKTPIIDAEGRTWTGCHALPGRWVLESNTGEAGNAYRWLASTMLQNDGRSEEQIHDYMDELAGKAPIGCDGVTAHLGPGLMNARRSAMKLGGLLFHVPFSAGEVQPAQLARAFMENLSYAIKANCDQLEAISGARIEQLNIGGGLSRSRSLRRILPDVLDLPVRVSQTADVSALGAAMCAAAGAGAYSGLEQAARYMRSPDETALPDKAAALEYVDHYRRWVSGARRLDEMNEALA